MLSQQQRCWPWSIPWAVLRCSGPHSVHWLPLGEKVFTCANRCWSWEHLWTGNTCPACPFLPKSLPPLKRWAFSRCFVTEVTSFPWHTSSFLLRWSHKLSTTKVLKSPMKLVPRMCYHLCYLTTSLPRPECWGVVQSQTWSVLSLKMFVFQNGPGHRASLSPSCAQAPALFLGSPENACQFLCQDLPMTSFSGEKFLAVSPYPTLIFPFWARCPLCSPGWPV